MDSLIRQMRLRYAGEQGNKEQPSSSISREKGIPIPNTESFKGDRKKGQSWFKKTQQKSGDDSDKAAEYATAIAAAALAVNSIQESHSADKKKQMQGPETSTTNVKSKKEEPEAAQASRQLSGKATIKSSDGPDRIVPVKGVSPAPSMGITLTASDERLAAASSKKRDDAAAAIEPQPKKQPSAKQTGAERSLATKVGGSKADIWEKAEFDKIQHRYDKMNHTISSWEENKKNQARRRKERDQAEFGQKVAKSIKRYNDKMSRIYQIAEGAKAAEKERRRREETKVKERANKIRTTGKTPASCFSF